MTTETNADVNRLRYGFGIKDGMGIPHVYVAGPFRGATDWAVHENCARAERMGARLVEMGIMPVIPHLNTRHFSGLQPDEWFLEGTLDLMRRCDAVVFLWGFRASAGAEGEYIEARALGMPTFFEQEDGSLRSTDNILLKFWAEEWNRRARARVSERAAQLRKQ